MVKKIVLWLLVICCMVMIFSFSSQPSDESSSLSDGLLDDILNFFNIKLPMETVVFLRMFIRKVAHFSVYGLLGYLVYILIHVGYNIREKLSLAATPVFCALYALSDEFHQIFISGRSGKPGDVLIDVLGACCGMLAAFLLCMLILRRKKNG